MAYYRDLREYLEFLDKAGKLRRVSRPINKDTELHPLVRWQYLTCLELYQDIYWKRKHSKIKEVTCLERDGEPRSGSLIPDTERKS
ncbi:MAG: hypothetical protein HYY29_02075 [Chloroflexi bacterium]|nr:hypothetical protein [Chloroflexota bacterium]